MSAEVDYTPSLQYSLVCRDGDLALRVSNYGWGDAESFRAMIDLSVLGAASQRNIAVINADTISASPAERPLLSFLSTRRGKPEIGEQNVFGIVDHRQLDLQMLPEQLFGDETWPQKYGRIVAPGYDRPRGGLHSLTGNASYKSTDGRSRTQSIRASSPRLIIVLGGRFEYVDYNDGVCACMMPPSYEYHLLLEPDQKSRTYENSIAHRVGVGEFERIWLVLASTKSAFTT